MRGGGRGVVERSGEKVDGGGGGVRERGGGEDRSGWGGSGIG